MSGWTRRCMACRQAVPLAPQARPSGSSGRCTKGVVDEVFDCGRDPELAREHRHRSIGQPELEVHLSTPAMDDTVDGALHRGPEVRSQRTRSPGTEDHPPLQLELAVRHPVASMSWSTRTFMRSRAC